MGKKQVFLESIRQALSGIACGGATRVTEVLPHSQNPDRIIHLDTWRCNATVSDYDPVHFADDLTPADLAALTELVEKFRTLTAPYGGTERVPDETARQADKIIERIGKILAQSGRGE